MMRPARRVRGRQLPRQGPATPMAGIARCAQTESGVATANPPPKTAIKSRRLTRSPRRLPTRRTRSKHGAIIPGAGRGVRNCTERAGGPFASAPDAQNGASSGSGTAPSPVTCQIQRPERFDLVINLKTAEALGLSVPLMLLATADEGIE